MNCWEIFLKQMKENAGWVQVLSSDPHVAAWCSPGTGEAGTRGSRSLQPAQPVLWTPASRARFCLENQVESYWTVEEEILCQLLASTHTCAQHMNMYTPHTQRLKEWCGNPQTRELCESLSPRDWAVSGWWEGLPFSPVVLTDFLHSR